MTDAAVLQMADSIGVHAWQGFLVLLALAVATAGVAVRSLPRPRTLDRSRASDASTAGRHLRVAAAWIVPSVTLFAVLAGLLGDGRLLQRSDEALSHAIGLHTPQALRAVFGVLTHFGEPLLLWPFGVAVAIGLQLRRHGGLALAWTCALLGNGLLNRLLKEIFGRARPLIDGVQGPATGFSFPSGHSSASVVAYTMLAYLGWRLLAPRWHAPLAMGAVAIILATACSRVFLQVHFASDVLAGMCSGLAWTVACIAGAERLRAARLGS